MPFYPYFLRGSNPSGPGSGNCFSETEEAVLPTLKEVFVWPFLRKCSLENWSRWSPFLSHVLSLVAQLYIFLNGTDHLDPFQSDFQQPAQMMLNEGALSSMNMPICWDDHLRLCSICFCLQKWDRESLLCRQSYCEIPSSEAFVWCQPFYPIGTIKFAYEEAKAELKLSYIKWDTDTSWNAKCDWWRCRNMSFCNHLEYVGTI